MRPVGVVVIGRKLEPGMTRGLRAAHGGVGFQGLEHTSRYDTNSFAASPRSLRSGMANNTAIVTKTAETHRQAGRL